MNHVIEKHYSCFTYVSNIVEFVEKKLLKIGKRSFS